MKNDKDIIEKNVQTVQPATYKAKAFRVVKGDRGYTFALKKAARAKLAQQEYVGPDSVHISKNPTMLPQEVLNALDGRAAQTLRYLLDKGVIESVDVDQPEKVPTKHKKERFYNKK